MNTTMPKTMTINERRAEIETSGERVQYFKAWPLIGRGGVRHDLASHEEIERMVDRGLNPPLVHRIRNFIAGRAWK